MSELVKDEGQCKVTRKFDGLLCGLAGAFEQAHDDSGKFQLVSSFGAALNLGGCLQVAFAKVQCAFG